MTIFLPFFKIIHFFLTISPFFFLVFILDSKCYIPSQGLSPNIPFILIQSKNAESVVRTNPLITSSEDLSSFIKDKQALPLGNHDFEKRYFNQPAWCMACSKSSFLLNFF